MSRLVAPIDHPTFKLIWASLRDILKGWQEDALPLSHDVEHPPWQQARDAVPDSQPKSCVSSPLSVRRAPLHNVSSSRPRQPKHHLSPVPTQRAKPLVDASGLAPGASRNSRYFRAPYVSAARDHAALGMRESGPPESDSSSSSDSDCAGEQRYCRSGKSTRSTRQHGSRVGTVSFRDRIKAFPKFSQPRPDLSWTDYLHIFTRMLVQHRVPASEWAVWLADRLQGRAQSLLVNLDEEDLDSWDRLVAAMNAQFHVTQDGAAAREQLMSRRQGSKEPVADFINDLQLLARRAYANDTAKRKEVIMDRLRDGLATPSLRQCFDACEEDGDMPFLALQNRLIHRESRDEPGKYRAAVTPALRHHGGSGQQNHVSTPKKPEKVAADAANLLVETLRGMQLFQQQPAAGPKLPPRTRFHRKEGVCWQCGAEGHLRRDCPKLTEGERQLLRARSARSKAAPSSGDRSRHGRGKNTTTPPASGTSTRGQGNA
jgi:hypothetical protein